MDATLCEPTKELVRAKCEKFDNDNQLVEAALKELFSLFPSNTNPCHALLKVVTLNRLYSTQIVAVYKVADHIQINGDQIDAALASGSPEIVESIARVPMDGGKQRFFYSFATKYCSWHNPDAYPIWDRFADRYIWTLQKQKKFTTSFKHDDLWSYPAFRKVILDFRDHYGLGSFSFKEIDKFLWQSGFEMKNANEVSKPNPETDISLNS